MTQTAFQNGHIEVERRPCCHVCGAGGRPALQTFRDRVSSVPGEWSLRKCTAPDCGLVWLDPMPRPSEISRLYQSNYFTHTPNPHQTTPISGAAVPSPMTWREQIRSGWRNGRRPRRAASQAAREHGVWERVGRHSAQVCRLLPGVSPSSRHPEYWLPDPPPSAKLLDVGCGSGDFLIQMKYCGWDVLGLEPDPEAVRTARSTHRLPVVEGTLETAQLNTDGFDAVSMLHVIEHVPDPGATLRRVWRLLRPGGRLLVITPNAHSLGARAFECSWIGWEPPRHLHVFTSESLQRLLMATGFVLERRFSSGRNARWTWDASDEIRRTGRCRSVERPAGTVWSRWGGRLARLTENLLPGGGGLGEELVAVAIKPPDGTPQASVRRSDSR